MTPACPLVLIRWQDSRQPASSWRFLSDVGSPRAVECASVGWLLRDEADVKVVCQNVGDLDDPDNAQASGIMTIPARCVVSIERLEETGSRPARTRKSRSNAAPAPEYVEEYFRHTAPASASPKDIRSGIKQRQQISLDFTQVRRAVDVLVERGVLETVAEKRWRLAVNAMNGSHG